MAINRPSGIRSFDYGKDGAVVLTKWQWVMMLGGLALLFACPLFVAGHIIHLINSILIIIIAVEGLNLLTGYCGQISLGQSAFVGIGAYTTGLLVTKLGFSFWATLPCAALTAGIVGLIFGLPSLRVKGFYLAMATLAAQIIIPMLIRHPLAGITGGTDGFKFLVPTLGGIAINTPESLLYVIAPIAILMVFFAKNLARSGVGRAFVAIRDNDLAAEVAGINVFRYKLLAFFICSMYAGVAGALMAIFNRWVMPSHFTLMLSIWYLGMLIVGGMGSISGAIFGVVFVRVLDFYVKDLGWWLGGMFPVWAAGIHAGAPTVVFGLVIILFIVLEPRGLAHRWEMFKSSYRLRPFAY